MDREHRSLDIHGHYEGGGVCQNCRDNTEGINCDRCKPGYYRPFGKNLNETDVCYRKFICVRSLCTCRCTGNGTNLEIVLNEGIVESSTHGC